MRIIRSLIAGGRDWVVAFGYSAQEKVLRGAARPGNPRLLYQTEPRRRQVTDSESREEQACGNFFAASLWEPLSRSRRISRRHKPATPPPHPHRPVIGAMVRWT